MAQPSEATTSLVVTEQALASAIVSKLALPGPAVASSNETADTTAINIITGIARRAASSVSGP
jgi:hypothetical protein